MGFKIGLRIKELEKNNHLDRCMKCNKVLEKVEERDILVCDGCSKRKSVKTFRHN